MIQVSNIRNLLFCISEAAQLYNVTDNEYGCVIVPPSHVTVKVCHVMHRMTGA